MLLTGSIVNDISQIIANLGFPIAVVIYLFYAQSQERKEHKEETQGFTTAIENNTIALQKMTDKLEQMEERGTRG